LTEPWNTGIQALLVVDGGPNDGRTIIIAKPTITLGRLADNDLVINEPAVSRKHAEITRTENGYYLNDLNTTNGTFVNRRNIGKESHLLQEGDRICLARTEVSFVFALDRSKTIQLPKADMSARGPGFIESLPEQPTTGRARAEALQENLRQLELAYQQATGYAQELAEELSEERQEEEASLQRQAAQAAREEERKRLAAELHDDTMADLAALALEVGLMRRHAGQASDASGGDMKEVEANLQQLGARLKDTNLRLRQMVQGISPTVLTELGLAPALRSYMEELSKRPVAGTYPLKLQLKVQGFDEGRLLEEVEMSLYRVAQQGVTNAIQHAQARNLVVELRWLDDEVTLSIADDGVGFDVENPKESTLTGHFGLSNLKERIEGIQGTLQITSKLSEGTTVSARIPCQAGTPRASEVTTSNYRLRIAPPDRSPDRG